jgi:ADP-ribosyl-[dinitrogen reductase] hydrolase
MIGAIGGDIIGSRFEGDSSPPEGFQLFHPRCRFTDDTVCSLAVADAVMRKADFASSLRTFVRRHPDRGYGGMFFAWAMQDDAPPYGSWGNGAPMRVAAIGWLARTDSEAGELAVAQARVSHDHPDAVAAAQAVARAIFALRQGRTVEAVRAGIVDTYGYDLRPETALAGGGFDVSAAGTVPAALAAAFEARDWEEAVRSMIRLGGDTDTLACIAGAVAEAIHGVPGDIADRARAYLTDDLAEILRRFDEQMARR